MVFQLYLVQPKPRSKLQDIQQIAEFIVKRKGIVLLVTNSGSLIGGFDDQLLQTVKGHPQVEFIGPVTMDPNGIFAKRLAKFLKNPLP
jgi:hypothetical protein